MLVQSMDHYMSCGRQMGAFAARAAEMAGVDPASAVVLLFLRGMGERRAIWQLILTRRIMLPQTFCPKLPDFVRASSASTIFKSKSRLRIPESGGRPIQCRCDGFSHHPSCGNECVSDSREFLSQDGEGRSCGRFHPWTQVSRSIGCGHEYQVGEEGRRQLIAAYDAGEFGSASYRPGHDLEKQSVELIGDSYGISLIPESWMRAFSQKQGLTVVEIIPRSWDGHHDIYFIAKG